MFDTTPRADLDESLRRIEKAIGYCDALLTVTPWLAGVTMGSERGRWG